MRGGKWEGREGHAEEKGGQWEGAEREWASEKE